jgi:hypothetical protein
VGQLQVNLLKLSNTSNLFIFELVEAEEVLLGVAPYLAAGSRANMLFDEPPIFTEKL